MTSQFLFDQLVARVEQNEQQIRELTHIMLELVSTTHVQLSAIMGVIDDHVNVTHKYQAEDETNDNQQQPGTPII